MHKVTTADALTISLGDVRLVIGDTDSWRREYDLYTSDFGKLFGESLRWPKYYFRNKDWYQVPNKESYYSPNCIGIHMAFFTYL